MPFLEEWNMKPVPWMPGAVPDFKHWVWDLASTSTYAERSWRDLSKGRWEVKNHGMGKDAVLRPPFGEEEASAFVPKSVKDNKRKRASTSEDPKSKTRIARKPRKNTIPLTEESVQRLRYEDEEEEDDGSVVVARVKKAIDASKAARSMVSASVHREACSRSRVELRRYEADLRRVTEERNTLRLLFGQREEEIKDLRDELAKAYQDQTDLTEQKLELIGKLREEVDMIRAETLGEKDDMDRLAAEKETARAQLSSAESQIQVMKEKISVQARKIEELEARLASELAKAKSDAEKVKANVDAFMAVYRADVEVAQIKRAKELESNVEALAFDDDDDDDGIKSESESEKEPDGEETASGDNQET
ncbi:uncharacterized protein [Nicotiana tomentosiformis]|uniref:uncharacterized protein n=1 Tax=Nicotiana tomentosiformis TaxID=4098 RepID=UPI00388C57BC